VGGEGDSDGVKGERRRDLFEKGESPPLVNIVGKAISTGGLLCRLTGEAPKKTTIY